MEDELLDLHQALREQYARAEENSALESVIIILQDLISILIKEKKNGH